MPILRDKGHVSRENWAAQGTKTVPYYIENVPPEDIEWGKLGMPDKGSAFPSALPSAVRFRARGFTAREAGDHRSSFVDVEYSTADIAHGAVTPPVPAGGTFLWSNTWSDDVVEIPYAFTRSIVTDVGDGAGIDPTVIHVWDFKVGSVRETRYTITARWEVFNPGLGDWAAIGLQHNRIHELGGIKYLFRASSLEPKDELAYEFKGTWELDTGTPLAPDPDPSTGLLYPNPNAAGGVPGNRSGLEYLPAFVPTFVNPRTNLIGMRDPYHELVATPPPDPPPGALIEEVEPIQIYHRRLYDEDLDGWGTLPNVPNFA
ncbi:MAG: hypothetical protein IID39_05135 [Planctomycetes bacterium]|nr:hypothetical protein [Planctomycetota bacterium]